MLALRSCFCFVLVQDDEEELEIEINNLDQATLHQLNAFCQKSIEEKGGADAIKKEGGAAGASAQKKK